MQGQGSNTHTILFGGGNNMVEDMFDFDTGFFDYVEKNEYEEEEPHPSDIWDKPLFEIEEEVL